jgi:hypothetical protein
MNLSCPSRLLDATNQSRNLFVGRWSPREFERSCMDTPEAMRRRQACAQRGRFRASPTNSNTFCRGAAISIA